MTNVFPTLRSSDLWRAELNRALGFGSSHLSLYQLTIEPGTRFATLASRGELTIPGDNDAADLFTLTQELTAAAGLPAYEVSNHARPGEESRHNLTYWRSEEHTSELQSLMRISYAVFCLKKKRKRT